MCRKKVITTLASGLVFVGCLLASVPFVRSLNPTPRADAALPRIDIESVKPGHYSIKTIGREFHGYSCGLLVYKRLDGFVRAWKLLVMDGAVGMPDIHWWRPMFECRNFGPGVANDTVNEELPIMCRDPEMPSQLMSQEWRWDINGRRLGKMTDDLEAVSGIVDGKYFVVDRTYCSLSKH